MGWVREMPDEDAIWVFAIGVLLATLTYAASALTALAAIVMVTTKDYRECRTRGQADSGDHGC